MITYTRMTASRARHEADTVTPDALDPVVIGSRVKALREAAGLSLRELALRSGVSAAMLSQVERGESPIASRSARTRGPTAVAS